jgi:hypothetical protein
MAARAGADASRLALFLGQSCQEIAQSDLAGCCGIPGFVSVFSKPCRKRFPVAANLPTPRLRVIAVRSRSHDQRISFSFGHGFRASRMLSCMPSAKVPTDLPWRRRSRVTPRARNVGHRSITNTAVYAALVPNLFKDFWRNEWAARYSSSGSHGPVAPQPVGRSCNLA